jgi:peptidoglycan/LPS O-acetylase OafA/YrhL
MNNTAKTEITLSDNVYFKQLDGIRCLAVMAVLICHWLTYRFIVLTPFGSMGVNLFFVLSGFLITRILLISKAKSEETISHKIKNFYIRRTIRIFPIYYLIVIFLVIFIAKARVNAAWLFTYTYNIKFSLEPWGNSESFLYQHLWSLSVEEQFYLFFPFLIFYLPQRRIKGLIFSLIALGILSRLVCYLFNAPPNAIYALTTCCLDSFAIGALLAYYILYNPDYLKSLLRKNYFFIIAVILFIADLIISRFFIDDYKECRTVLERLLFSICCFWIVGKAAVASYSGLFKRFLENKYVIYIGKISYGLYIYHYFIGLAGYWALNKLALLPEVNPINIAIRALMYFVVTLVVSIISWKIIEQPINKLKTKFK